MVSSYRFVLTVCWLWRVAGSDDKSFTESGPTTKDVVCHGSLTEYDKILINFTCGDPIIYYYCDGMSDGEFNCTISFKDSSTQLGHCNNLTSTPTNCESTCDNENKEPSDPEVTYTDSMTKASQLSRDTSTSNSSTTILVVLGALIGLLLVLLVMVTTGLLWTCWLLKRRGGIMFNNELQLRSSTDHGQLVNPTYEGDDLLHLKPQQPAPAYETIPPHPSDGARLEFVEQGKSGYHVLHREQRAIPETITATRHMETILEDSREESYSKLELREESGGTEIGNEEGVSEYSKLETMNVKSNMPKDTPRVNGATVDSNDDSSKRTEKKSIVDDKAFDDNGDALQLENGEGENGQEEEAKGEPPLITITLDVHNERKDSANPESSTTD